MSRRVQIKPDGAYYGHGLSIEELPSTTSSELDSLRAENQQLREQLQYQQQLLAIWHQQPCALCQIQGPSANSTASNTTTSRSLKPTKSTSSSSADASADDQGASDSCSTPHSNINKAFRQQQVRIAQLQRQVMILEVELSSREQLVLEADAVLAETSRRLAPIVALREESAAGGSRSGSAPANRPGLSSTTMESTNRRIGSIGQRSSTRASQQGAAAVAAAGVGSIGSGASAVDQVLQHARGLHSWCRSTIARLGRARAESAANCRAARRNAFITNSAVSGAGTTDSWDTGSDGASSLQQLQLQCATPGGNRFLPPGTSLHLAAIARGQACAALNAAVLQQLTPQLAGLAQGLAALAVQLRTIVLPVMPWLSTTAAEQLTSNTAVLAGEAASAAAQLVEACSVLPAVAGTLSGPAAAAGRKGLRQTAAAEQQAGLWGAVESPWGRKLADEEVQQLLQLDPEDASLLQGLSDCLAESGKVAKAGSSIPGTVAASSSSSRKSMSLGGSCSATKQHRPKDSTSQQQLGTALLQQLQQRWAVLWLTKQVLEQQLSFVARCSSEQAKLVSSLTKEVVAAITAAAEQSESQHGLQQRQLDAQQLIQQVQRALLLLQQRPGEVSSRGNAERTLIGLLLQQQPVLDDIPELLLATSAQSIKAAALDAVTAVFKEFSAGVRTARADTEALCVRLHSGRAEDYKRVMRA